MKSFLSPKNLQRVLRHILFWSIFGLLCYLSYIRVAGDYVWVIVIKEFVVVMTLFYSISWFISRRVVMHNPYLILVFFMLGYVWWAVCTYTACYIVAHHVHRPDDYFDKYLDLVMDQGLIGLFGFEKFSDLVLDYIYMISIPVGPKLVKSYMQQSNEQKELEREHQDMEKRLLKLEITPHFLLNALGTIYWKSERQDPDTPAWISRLSQMLQFVLYGAPDARSPLQKEADFIQNYVDFMQINYDHSVPIELQVETIDERHQIYPNILITLVENAFKHGPNTSRKNAWVNIKLEVIDGTLHFFVRNGVNRAVSRSENGGVGLQNVRRKLQLYYPGAHQLGIIRTDDEFQVILQITL